jgi:hypothetical protein
LKEWLLVIINIILAAITGWYAWLTRHMVKATREQFEASIRPYIGVDVIVPSSAIFILRIRNLGTSPAENLRLTLSKNFYRFGGSTEEFNLAKEPAFNKPIQFFAPNAELFFDLGPAYAKYDSDLAPAEFDVTCMYEYAGKKAKEITNVDLGMFTGSTIKKDPIVEQLEKLRKSVGDLTKAVEQLGASR